MQNYGVFLAISYVVIGHQGDTLWNKSDDDFAKFAVDELAKIDIIEKHDNMVRYPVLLYVLHMIATLETTTLWFDKVCAISAPGFTPGWHLIRLNAAKASEFIGVNDSNTRQNPKYKANLKRQIIENKLYWI